MYSQDDHDNYNLAQPCVDVWTGAPGTTLRDLSLWGRFKKNQCFLLKFLLNFNVKLPSLTFTILLSCHHSMVDLRYLSLSSNWLASFPCWCPIWERRTKNRDIGRKVFRARIQGFLFQFEGRWIDLIPVPFFFCCSSFAVDGPWIPMGMIITYCWFDARTKLK